MSRSYSQRKPSEYNIFRKIFTMITCCLVYGLYYKIACNMTVKGRENVPKKGFYIVASNHMSAVDPFLVIAAIQRPVAYMAKKELFESKWGSFFLNLLGAFAVNREKLEVSTMKTALGIKNTDWLLGLFPQGTREADGDMHNVARGFAAIAKTTKSDILPVAISGAAKDERKPFKGKIKINIGKPIPYNHDTHEMVKVWIETMGKLTAELEEPEKKKKIDYKKYTRKTARDFNILTWLYQLYALRILFIPFIANLFYKFKISGNRKALKGVPCIVASNHISYFDPFIVSWAVRRKLAFMAKKELFEDSLYLAKNISRLGGFPVNREKLEVSTIKTTKEVFKAKYNLCIFPQGGIRKNKKIENVNKGFLVFARMFNVDILPVSIAGLESYNWNIFKRPVVDVKVGNPISYNLSDDEIIDNWRKQIADMSGYELVSES